MNLTVRPQNYTVQKSINNKTNQTQIDFIKYKMNWSFLNA